MSKLTVSVETGQLQTSRDPTLGTVGWQDLIKAAKRLLQRAAVLLLRFHAHDYRDVGKVLERDGVDHAIQYASCISSMQLLDSNRAQCVRRRSLC